MKDSPEFPTRFLGLFGGQLGAKRYSKGCVAGGGQLGKEGFDAGDGGGDGRLVGVEQRGDEVGRDGFHWLALPANTNDPKVGVCIPMMVSKPAL